jgi:predicted metal-dependent hydrolase
MSNTHHITFGGKRIEFRLRRSTRKTLGITVQPDASVMVAAPLRAELEKVKCKVRKRAVWIKRQQRFFDGYLPTLPPRRFVSGETHRYLGRQYRLKVKQGEPEGVKLKGQFILVQTQRKPESKQVGQMVGRWYAGRATDRFERSLAKCLVRFHGRIQSPRLSLRKMRNRWGSWTSKGTIYLNPELVQAPPSCIDYVITHELCHVVHGDHGEQFYALLRWVMPDWEHCKARLERSAAN